MISSYNMSKIYSFDLDVNIDEFLTLFWLDNGEFINSFLAEELSDLNINVGEWRDQDANGNNKSRVIRSYHPSKISFPGVPSHAETCKQQTIIINSDKEILINEVSSFKGIPYADYFSVNTEWTISSKSQLLNEEKFNYNHNENINRINIDDSNEIGCNISITLQVIFHKSTWLQGTIESNTKAELIGVFELWYKKAQNYIHKTKRNKSNTKLELAALGIGSNSDCNIDTKTFSSRNNSSSFNIIDRKESKSKINQNDDSYASDEELLFYDCEEGAKISKINSMKDYNTNYIDEDNDQLFQKGPTSTKEIVSTIVETIFVLFEFGIWRIHSIYMYEMKDLFRLHPSAFFRRTINAFLPGWHSPVLSNPDLYGPILAIFLLPQILLFSIESKHGCNRTALLGNAVVVSLCLWFGLSAFYRFLAFLIAPAIEFKHCMCMTGYSFFSWSLALLLSYPLDVYQDVIGIPTSLPLVIFGLPSAIALGCMFWEYTPNSSITLQPAIFPSSLQQFAQHNSRILQKLLWAIPKIIAFIIVTGTHYQFLWYLATSFLPGKKQLCRLSALLNPTRYSDILSQKEIRKFAISIIKGK